MELLLIGMPGQGQTNLSKFFAILGGNSLHNSCWYKVQETKSNYRTNKYPTRKSNPNWNLEHNLCFTKLCLQDRHIAPSHKLFEFLLSFIVVKNSQTRFVFQVLAKKWSMWLFFSFKTKTCRMLFTTFTNFWFAALFNAH